MLLHAVFPKGGLNQKIRSSTMRQRYSVWINYPPKLLYLSLTPRTLTLAPTGNIKDWHIIASKLPGRTNRDCRKRWINKVRGTLKKGAWAEDEDIRLLQSIKKYGMKSVQSFERLPA